MNLKVLYSIRTASLRSAQAHPAFNAQMRLSGTAEDIFSVKSLYLKYLALWYLDKTSYVESLTQAKCMKHKSTNSMYSTQAS